MESTVGDIRLRRPRGFYGALVIQHSVGDNVGILGEEFSYVDKRGLEHLAHVGMPTDGLTIRKVPRAVWWLTGSPYGKYLAAAIIHDWYCIRANDLSGEAKYVLRLKADRLFVEMLDFLGASRMTQRIMYAGVRWGAKHG